MSFVLLRFAPCLSCRDINRRFVWFLLVIGPQILYEFICALDRVGYCASVISIPHLFFGGCGDPLVADRVDRIFA